MGKKAYLPLHEAVNRIQNTEQLAYFDKTNSNYCLVNLTDDQLITSLVKVNSTTLKFEQTDKERGTNWSMFLPAEGWLDHHSGLPALPAGMENNIFTEVTWYNAKDKVPDFISDDFEMVGCLAIVNNGLKLDFCICHYIQNVSNQGRLSHIWSPLNFEVLAWAKLPDTKFILNRLGLDEKCI